MSEQYKSVREYYNSREAAFADDEDFVETRNAIRAKENAKIIGDGVQKVLSGEELIDTGEAVAEEPVEDT